LQYNPSGVSMSVRSSGDRQVLGGMKPTVQIGGSSTVAAKST
jgi:hypothetical protein